MTLIPFDDRDGVIWFNGAMVPWRDAKIHVLTHALHYASAVFEGARVYGGRVFKLKEHSQRLIDSGRILGFELPWTLEQIMAAAPPLVEQHRASFGRFIERQINEWHDATLVGELERNIGADLQYIRINGTLVGGAAGLAIYAITRWASG